MAQSSSPISAVAERYAGSLFELALQDNSVAKVEADLAGFEALLNGSDDLKRLINSPVFSSEDQAKAIGAMHGGGNVIVLLLFGVSWWLRHEANEPLPTAAWIASFCGTALALFTAWLGGELVDRLGVGVSPHAHLNARSSLDGPAEPPSAAEAARQTH